MQMNIDYGLLKSKNVVFLADLAPSFENIKLDDIHLEMTEHETYILIMDTLKQLCNKVYHYDSIIEFENNIKHYKDDIVLSLWSGVKSRNRKALVPSICEANNICYVGADAYVHIISQDKQLAKEFCSKYNIYGARDVFIRTTDDYSRMQNLTYPIVIKPNYEGGSIGISNKNIAQDYAEAISICNRLLDIYEAILAEEYIPGYEVCICISGVLGNIDIFEAVQSNFGGQTYITNQIYGYEYKKK